jgi:hypothetical protein
MWEKIGLLDNQLVDVDDIKENGGGNLLVGEGG